MPVLSARSAPYLFAFLLSAFMTFIVSGVATLVAIGPVATFVSTWMRSWITAWIIAFPALLVVRPMVHRLVARLTS